MPPRVPAGHGARALVVALNPSIDAEWRVARVRWEEKNEVLSERRWPGGKGVNVARWLRRLSHPATLLLPLGGATGRELARQLREETLPARVLPVRQSTRVNIIVTQPAGHQLRFNPVWQRLTPGEWRSVLAGITRALGHAKCLVLSGSIPRGIPATAYAQIIRRARSAGLQCILDCDGAPFAAAVAARPFLVKPNQHELAQWIGRPLGSTKAVLEAARVLSAATRGWVLVSRGAAGAVLVHAANRAAWVARAVPTTVLNTVGAGDALLAAVVGKLTAGALPEDWLRWGVGTGCAATACPAGRLPRRSQIERVVARVHVRAVRGGRPIAGPRAAAGPNNAS